MSRSYYSCVSEHSHINSTYWIMPENPVSISLLSYQYICVNYLTVCYYRLWFVQKRSFQQSNTICVVNIYIYTSYQTERVQYPIWWHDTHTYTKIALTTIQTLSLKVRANCVEEILMRSHTIRYLWRVSCAYIYRVHSRIYSITHVYLTDLNVWSTHS